MKISIKKIFLGPIIALSLLLFSGNFIPESSAHAIIPDDIMEIILENEDITDEEIDALFEERYGMGVEEYTEKKEIEIEEGTRDSLEGDPEYDAFLQRQYEENEALRNNPNLSSLKENIDFESNFPNPGSIKNTENSGNIFSQFFENIQQQEQKKILEIRKNIKNRDLENISEISGIQNIKNSVFAGVLHIWGGIDHILFFLTLLLVMRPFKQILLILSTFTVAHSITLLLVGSGALSVNTKLIEIIIAVSIVYSAVFAGIQLSHNTSKKTDFSNFKHTLLLVFIFGLFHGMGFAEVFEKFNFSFSEYWEFLILYNIGIEIGQILLLLLFFPPLYFLYQKKWGQKFLILTSFVIATLAVMWVFERI